VQNLLPIGRFSKMTRLSVKALRHYDELGLLAPAVVDPFSGYRYYTYSQANRAEAIRILRGLDVPLEDVRELLASEDPEIAGSSCGCTAGAWRSASSGTGGCSRSSSD
jgi:DNA-binding transcriptional MerR regulator